MRILMVQTFYYYRGGDSTYMFNLSKLLEENGHEVIPFAMHHPQNLASPYEKYFVSEIDFPELSKRHSPLAAWKVLSRSIYSREAKRKIEALIENTVPDVIHLHNIHGHLTSSIITPLWRRGIPTIWTLHDYRLLCPNTTFLRWNEVCERCVPSHFYEVLRHRCKKESYTASFIAMITSYVDRLIRMPSRITHFIAPSRFLRSKMIEAGFAPDRISWIPNFVDFSEFHQAPERDYYLYFGRLSDEKGVGTLIRAAAALDQGRLLIVGTGPNEERLREIALRLGSGRIEFAGYRTGEELKQILRESQFVVLPSEWYENCPLSIIEAFASGKAVVASQIGGLPEMIEDGVNGLLFPAGDSRALAGCLERMLQDKADRESMGRRGREMGGKLYNREEHYRRIISVYDRETKRNGS